MKKICQKLLGNHIPLQQYSALEFFGREGDWQTYAYSDKVKDLTIWEINPEFEAALTKNFPSANICIGDSFALAKKSENENKFQFIVIDNPQNIFGNYCEHFEVLSLVKNLLNGQGVVIFNINWKPFDYVKFSQWQKRREDFYKIKDTANISLQWLTNFYKEYFAKQDFTINDCFAEKRNDEYLAYIVCILEKRTP